MWPSTTFFLLDYYCLQILVAIVGISSAKTLPLYATKIKICEMKLSLYSILNEIYVNSSPCLPNAVFLFLGKMSMVVDQNEQENIHFYVALM